MVRLPDNPLMLVDKLLKRWGSVKTFRQPLEGLLQEVTEFVFPHRSDFLKEINDFRKISDKIYDGTAQSALMIWVDGIQGYIVSSAIKWFTLSLVSRDMLEYDEVKQWLKIVEELIYERLGSSNFYSILDEYLLDGGSTGTANTFIHENRLQRRIQFNVEHPKNVWIVQDEFGDVTEFYRLKEMTLEEAAEKFGESSLSAKSRSDLKSNPFQKASFLWIVLPNFKRKPNAKDFTAKPLLSYHIEVDEKTIVRKGGYTSMPGAFWRTRRRNGYAYGISPGECALRETKILQGMSKTLMRAGQMAADGPYNVPEEMKGHSQLVPRGINFYKDASRLITPVHQSINYPIGLDREDRIRESIRRWYSVDYFLAMQNSSREKTAEEIRELQAERAVLLGPQMERLSGDSLDDVIKRIYDIMVQANELPDPPQMLIDAGGEPVKIEYIGPLLQQRKQHYVMRSVRQNISDLGQLAMVDASVLDNYDLDELSRYMTEVNGGFPSKVIVSKDVRDQRRQQRAAAQQAQQNMALAGSAADAAGKLSKPIDPSSALAQLAQSA